MLRYLILFLVFISQEPIQASNPNYYETDKTYVKLSTQPVMPGHSVIRFHHPISHLEELSTEDVSELVDSSFYPNTYTNRGARNSVNSVFLLNQYNTSKPLLR